MADLENRVYDVAIVGLGPVGAVAAQLLAREGLQVLAVEPSRLPYDKPRAIGIDHESMRLLQSIGIAEDLRAYLGAYRPSEYRSGSGQVLKRIVPQPEPYPLAWPPYNTFVQPELERLLRAGLDRWNTLEVLFGWSMTAIEQDADETRLTIATDEGGDSRTVRARYVIGCDGAWSPVREAVGLKLEDLSFDESWLVIDALVDEGTALPDVIIQYCDPARPCTFVPGPGRLKRWEIMLLPGEDAANMLEERRLWSLLSPWITPDVATIWRAASYRFHALVATQWQHERVFIAGDAAHQTPPFMAQGLNQGLRDVGNLCWKLGEVLLRGADPVLLESYDAERRPNARVVIELTKQFGKLICERDPAAAAERDRALLAEWDAGRGEVVRQDLLPPISAGFLMSDDLGGFTLGAGTVFPQPWIAAPNGDRRMDDALPSHFLMVVPGSWTAHQSDLDLAHELAVSLMSVDEVIAHAAVTRVADLNGLISSWLARYQVSAVMVRPDHVVFGSASGPAGPRQLLETLNRQRQAVRSERGGPDICDAQTLSTGAIDLEGGETWSRH